MHIADSLCYTAETNTTMQSNYTPLKLWKEGRKEERKEGRKEGGKGGRVEGRHTKKPYLTPKATRKRRTNKTRS